MERVAFPRPSPGADSRRGPSIVAASKLTKHFPGVLALREVGLTIEAGEIVALLGQNGAGKSTLIQILAGVHAAGSYSGELRLAGVSYRPTNVAEAERAGVALVPQEINVVPELSVAENICLNAEPTRWGVIDVAGRLARARSALRDFDLDVDPASQISKLDLATQQLVIIARALSKKARLLILDEPTAALTENESHHLFDRLRVLRARGVAIIFVSHRLAEVFAISDRIIVMRDGVIRGDYRTHDVSRPQVVAAMLGDVETSSLRSRATALDEVALEVRDLAVFEPSDDRRARVRGLNLRVHKGEIVGLFGLLGAGCIEAALAIYGAWVGESSGEIHIAGETVTIASPADAVALGMGLMAQDRRDCLVQDQSVKDNILIASLKVLTRRRALDIAASRRLAADQVVRLKIKASSIDAEVSTLSGGNQQKVQVARWLAARARILVLIDPTRGVDVGARSEIKRIWSDLTGNGQAILLASTDVEELIDVCSRIIVMRQGRAVAELSGERLNEANLLRAAADG
jgi:ABC-type sugar transport system ATPase subunit